MHAALFFFLPYALNELHESATVDLFLLLKKINAKGNG
jgi:hypothetical protein